jgi:outer membrane protein
MIERPSLAACALALALLPGAAFSMDIVQAFRDSLANDAIVAAARAQLEATRERVPQARAGLLPSVNANANLNYTTFDTSLAQRREFDSQNYSISLSYPLYRRQNTEAFEQSKLGVTLAEYQFEAVRQDLMLRVSQAYFDVLSAQDTLETILAQKRAISEQYASAKRNFEVGTATITDQQEAQARFDLIVAQEFAANNDLDVKRAALAQLTGKVVPDLRVLRPGVTLEPPQPDRQTAWTDVARSNNLVVQQATVASAIAAREIDRQRYGHHPTLDLVGSTSYFKGGNTQIPNDFNSNSAQIGVQFVLPIYQGGLVDARVREAVSLKEKTAQDLENARRQAEQAARQTFLGVNSGLAQVQALEAAEKSTQLALDSNLLGYQVGVRNNLDVLVAQQQLFTIRRDLAKARYDVLLNGLRLKSTVGALSEADLQGVAALLDAPTVGNGSSGASTAPASVPPPPPASVTPPAPVTPATR